MIENFADVSFIAGLLMGCILWYIVNWIDFVNATIIYHLMENHNIIISESPFNDVYFYSAIALVSFIYSIMIEVKEDKEVKR